MQTLSTWVLLLRGVNVGGKRPVRMGELQAHLLDAGFTEVRALLNSGNLVLRAPRTDRAAERAVQDVLTARFDFEIPFVLIPAEAYQAAFAQLPAWWAEPAARRDVLFYLDPAEGEAIREDIQRMQLHCERVCFTEIAAFWVKTDEREFQRTAYHRQLITREYYRRITIRNARTAEKLCGMLG